MRYKQQLAEPDRLQFNIVNGVDNEVGGCVYKLYCGNKYIINKGKTLSGSIFLLEKGYAYSMAFKHAEEKNEKPDYWFLFYDYIKRHPQYVFQIEVLFESENPYQLLKREQMELDESLSDKNCLNNNLIAYIPQWISKGHRLSFYKYLKNR